MIYFNSLDPILRVFKAPRTPNNSFKFYSTFGKKIFDILIISAALLPIVIIIAAAWIWARKDGGSGFYWQWRVGKNGKPFRCFKLRTMKMNADELLKRMCAEDASIAAEWEKNQKLRNDPRIIRGGRFLRETSIDELPQIFNVILGDMSLIGPRPFTVEQDRLYREAGGTAYYDLKPGLTGLWQINARGTSEFVARVIYDNTYARSLCFPNDLRIMLKTVGVLWRRTGA